MLLPAIVLLGAAILLPTVILLPTLEDLLKRQQVPEKERLIARVHCFGVAMVNGGQKIHHLSYAAGHSQSFPLSSETERSSS
jgi:hypothetical protein